ncbi:MAG TPA: FAD-dependent oxidoreductase [Albitalea sp.]|uniref:FAD-dependent oxidoreductase n=1 Tax=Piscinibacter sp. TaxID=1903157 RepID=UPI002ED6820C
MPRIEESAPHPQRRPPSSDVVQCDALVVGSGASGLVAAITARFHGLDVHVIEKQPQVGGCSAYSLGMLWMPCNPLSARAGLADDRAAACTYLRGEMEDHYDAAGVEAYLEHGPRMIEFLERECGVRFELRENFPDYHSERPGASQNGRTVLPQPFDGRTLGPHLQRLRPPPPRATLFGMTFTPSELGLVSSRSAAGLRHLCRRLGRHLVDLLLYRRSTHLTGGNALVGALFKAARELDIPIHTQAAMSQLLTENGRVSGALVQSRGRHWRVQAQRGVVLACGGAGHDMDRCAGLFERPQLAGRSWALGPEGCDGDGVRAAIALGAAPGRVRTAAFWAPVSRLPDAAGSLSTHSRDRFLPGFIAITPDGRRFANEAESNHHFCEALLRATAPGQAPQAWLVCDQPALSRIGLGDLIHGAPFPIGKHLRSGYVIRRHTLRSLAEAMRVDGVVFDDTVRRFNAAARNGRDDEFGKGSTRFNRSMSPCPGTNPCLGALERPPYYAVRISVGHMGTLAGLQTDLHGQALDHDGRAIAGLYLAGNDRVNVFRGACPGGGITLGPGMTWAHLTGLALAGVPAQVQHGPEAVAAPVACPLPVQATALEPSHKDSASCRS